MQFVFRIGVGQWEIAGNSQNASAGVDYYRNGTYRLDGDQLISPIINEGKPARLYWRDGWLSLTIGETLTLRLRRDLGDDDRYESGSAM